MPAEFHLQNPALTRSSAFPTPNPREQSTGGPIESGFRKEGKIDTGGDGGKSEVKGHNQLHNKYRQPGCRRPCLKTKVGRVPLRPGTPGLAHHRPLQLLAE